MKLNSIFADPEGEVTPETKRFVLSAEYSKEELLSFGIHPYDVDFDKEYLGSDELSKLKNLWSDVSYLSELYYTNLSKFDHSFWQNISEEQFVEDTLYSSPRIFKGLETEFWNGTIDGMFKSLHKSGEESGYAYSVKSKFGEIKRRYAFRIYAIKIDASCYIITGGTIKLTETMQDAANTRVELKKINHVYKFLNASEIDSKETFFDFVLE